MKNKILQKIVEQTKRDLKKRKKRHSGKPKEHPESRKGTVYNLSNFRNSILNPKKDITLIAEIKLASPSEGDLGSKKTILKRVKAYEKADADAISLVVEKHFFNGDIKLIDQIKKNTNLPILMKDFIIDTYQIAEGIKSGADAVLLIARIVGNKKLSELVQYAIGLGIEPVVEIDSLEHIERAIDSKPYIIAVNARDLDTFEVDVDRASEILKQVPDKFIKLGFSGIKSSQEVQKYREAGAKGVLVGTSLMKAKNIKDFILSLRTK